MIPNVDRREVLCALYDWEEKTRRSVPALFWYRLANIHSMRWPRC